MSQNLLYLRSNESALYGLPWVTSSFVTGSVNAGWVQVDFPWVTKRLVVQNIDSSGSLLIAFTSGGLNSSNTWTLAPSGTFDNFITIKSLWLKQTGTGTHTSFQVSAEMTTTPRADFPDMTGSATSTQLGDTYSGLPTLYSGI